MTDQLPPKFLTTPIPANEPERLAALHRYQILDTSPEVAFDRITTLAARLFNKPIALISLVDESRAWFKSCIGFAAREVPRDATLCSFAVLTEQPLIIPDTRLDDRFACNPFVQSEPGVRFYAGAPLLSHDGFNLGTLCLLDTQPRDPLSAEQQATLVDLAAMVVDELELRLAAQKIAQVDEALLEITQGVATVTGEAFFAALVRHFAKVLNADYAYIGLVESDDPKMMRTIATCAHGQIVDNFKYPLQDTPCWEVIEQGKICCYPRNVQAHFPNAPLLKPLEVESYVAIPFFNSSGIPLGLLGVMDGKPLENVQLTESLLTLFAQRIATELERQQIEQERERFLDVGSDLQVITRADGYFAWVSPSFERLLGWTVKEITSRPWTDFVHPDDVNRSVSEVDGLFCGSKTLAFENRYRHKDGSYRWLLWKAQLYSEKQVLYGAAVDITERKQGEQALRQSEEQSRNILESIDDGFFALNQHWQFTYVNQSAEAMLNRASEDLIGKDFWQEVPGVSGSEFEQMHRGVMRDRVAQSLTAFYPDHERWYEVRTYPAANGITIYFRNVTEQIQTATTLRQSEERYRTLFESIDEGFCVVEILFDAHNMPIDYRVLEVNPTFEQQTGLRQAVGKTARQLNLEEHWIEVFGQVALTGESIRFENGSQVLNRWFDVYACRTGEPEARKVAIVFKDISDRKQAEEISLRTAELDAFRVSLTDALRPLADSVEIQATANRVLGKYLGANRVAYFEVRGADYVVERDYINGVKAIAGHYPVDSFGQKLFAVYRTGRTVSVSDVEADPHLSSEQRSAYAALQVGAHISIPLVKEGEFVAGLTVHTAGARDWTSEEVSLAEEVAERTWAAVDRARAESALRQSEARFRTLISASANVLYRMNADWSEMHELQGGNFITNTSEPIHDWLQKYIHPDDQARVLETIAAVIQNKCLFELEHRVRQADGTLGWTYSRAVPLLDSAGEIVEWFGEASDISDRKQAEAEREQLLQREQTARETAENANRIKDEFLAVLSHELRSPLNPILGWTRLLQSRKLDAARQHEALVTIERNAKLQSQLIEDLLDISRIMQGKLSLTVAPVSLTFVISAALETVRLAAEAKNIAFVLDIDPNIPPISGDAARLQQVLWNLLANAVKFTANGGQVTIELRHLDPLAQIRVIDSGKGIDPNFLPYVFEYFRQEDGSTTRRFGGLGLGLAIVRQIIEMHGGTVKAESGGENQGATFIVQLPIALQLAPSVPEPTQMPTDLKAPLDNIQILLVDDEPDTREFQAFLLEQSGAKVTAVASGLEALQVLDRSVPDVLVSDLGMPDMDGYMLIEQIRDRLPHHGGAILALALTAYAAEVDEQRAIKAGFQAFVTKPVEPEKLVKVISSLLNDHQQQVEKSLYR